MQKRVNFSVLTTTPKDNMYFITINQETISAIRALNHLDANRIYALDGIVLRDENILKMHTYLDESFFYEIQMYLKGNVKDSEKDVLTDFKYALLATSTTLEEEGAIFPKPNNSLTVEEVHAAETYLLPKVKALTEYLFNIYDENIRPHTIVYILYVKACMNLLPPLYKEIIMEELKNSIHLQRMLGLLIGKENKELCSMMSCLCEESFIKEKKY